MMNDNAAMHMHPHCGSKFSWSAIFAGALVGVGTSFLLNLFAMAIGLSAFTTSPAGLSTLAVGGFVGMLIGVIVSMYATGWVAGCIARPMCHKAHHGMLYGFVAWVVALLMVMFLAAPVGRFINLAAETRFHIAAPTTAPNAVVLTNQRGNAVTVSANHNGKTKAAVVDVEKATNTLVITIFFRGAATQSQINIKAYARRCNR